MMMRRTTRAKGRKVNLRIRKAGIRERADMRLGRGHQAKELEKEQPERRPKG